MASRKEEERNEKIIRGLMKLPPNRRCINCNSLGPQYVCTNFWTFVCMTCSGIHREFTHRVKSVSMAKFTSQEVEALQNGGNQRARELYLRDWDFQRQRLPDSSNVDKIRDFIKNVYVHRRYSGSKSSDKPPRDMQSSRIHDDETRRASSYHSYSQSPPYDYQYEDRRYGKQAATLTRKPGSDKGHYEGRMSGLIYSPGHLSDHAYSDKDIGFSSPSYQRSSADSSEDLCSQARNMCLETNAKKDADGICHPHRTTSLGSIDSNLSSSRSQNSDGLVDFFSEPVQGVGSHPDKVSVIPRSAGPARSISLDFSDGPGPSSASSVDLFQLPASSPAQSVDLFQSSVSSSVPSLNGNQPSHIPQPSPIDLFVHTSQQQSAAIPDEKPPELSVPKNEGWATFDMPPSTSLITHAENPSGTHSTNASLQEGFDPFSTLNPGIQWPSFEASNVDGSSIISDTWHDSVHIREEQASVTAANAQPWNAFEDFGTHLPVDTPNQGLERQNLLSNEDDYFGFRASEGFNIGGMHGVAPVGGFDDYNIPSLAIGGLPYPPSVPPLMGETQSGAVKRKSTNPFDLPFDSSIEQSNMFLDMSSLQAALPDAQLPPTFPDGIAEPWLPQNSATQYISATGQGGLTYMAAQPPNPKLPNVQTQGPVASLGGNPFA